ncbi:S-adenosyl-L-methionine-dependent methyltransferase [Chlamydoabsidia padenii]|nr:S-adenosyl-L-methionine-dependent methyltransferase [Chlamydoabsidia padenii]
MNFYQHAGQIIDKLGRHEGTIKGLVLGDPKVQDKKKMYALVCETLKYKHVLNEIIDTTNLCVIEKKLKRSLALVLLHDLLFTKRGIPVNSKAPLKQCITRHQARLKAELVKIKIKKGVTTNTDLLSQKSKDALHIPRYVRVNEHKSTVQDMIKCFQNEGYTFVDTPEDLRTLGLKSFCKDAHLNDVLVFPPKTDLHIHPKYVAGDIILQDKASCFPAHVAQIPINVHAIDACAAPGNKTSHLSALMKNTGRIWAFDLDQRRLQTLKKLTTKAGCRNIEAIHGSFLETDPLDSMYSKVEYLLLDPSCSGSGIVSRLDHLVDDDSDEQENADGTITTREERLQNLSDFQISIIEHALKFPNAKRIVYSTCSIHALENEKVVETILSRHPEFTLASRDTVLPTWKRRGFTKEMGNFKGHSDSVVRTLPSEDLTNGFFVACFVRNTMTSSSGDIAATKTSSQDNSTSSCTTTKRTITEIDDQNLNKNKKKKKNNKKRNKPITL